MKNIADLVIDTKATRQMDKKYYGDPDSPNFLPESPLIDRPVITTQQENDLKRICAVVLADTKTEDDAGADPLTELIQSLKDQEGRPKPEHMGVSRPHVPAVPPPTKPMTNVLQRGVARKEVEAIMGKPSQRGPPNGAEVEALQAIRSQLQCRPKTSAAACVDYAEDTDGSSRPSNRTTYSTPATSAGITPSESRKRFVQSKRDSEDQPAVPPLTYSDSGPSTRNDSPSRGQTHFRSWMDSQIEHDRQNTDIEADDSPMNLREFYPMRPAERSQHLHQPTRANSIRDSIREYFRPGSSSGANRQSFARPTPSRQGSSFGSTLMDYIRPISSSGSVRSNATSGSNRPPSRTQDQWSSIKRKISNASRRSRSSWVRPDPAAEPEHPPHPSGLDQNKPLPPLPGLDTYREKPTHIASLMMNIQSPADPRHEAHNSGDSQTLGSFVTANEEKRRTQYSFASQARSTTSKTGGSAGSMPTNARPPLPTQMSSESIERMVTALPPATHVGKAVGASPLSKATIQQPSILKSAKKSKDKQSFQNLTQKWSGKLAFGKKTKGIAII